MAGTAADARETAFAAGQAARTPELAAVAAADTRDAALAAGAAARTAVDPAGPAVAVGIATAAAGFERNEVRDAGAGSARPRRDNVS